MRIPAAVRVKPKNSNLRLWQLGLLLALFAFWHIMTVPGLIPPLMFDNESQAAFVDYLILQAEGSFDINTVMAGIVVLTAFALALALDALVWRAEKRLMKWQPRSGETEKL